MSDLYLRTLQVTQSTPGSTFVIGGGEMGRLVREKDWSRTPLGSISSWSQSLLTTVNLCLASNCPIALIWGPHHVYIYNDEYLPICGDKHPHALGQDFTECWATAFPDIIPAFRSALAGTTVLLEDQRIFLNRFGFLEETFFTFSFSPIRDETGRLAGLFHPVTETTGKVLGQRRTHILRKVAAHALGASSMDTALQLTARALADFDLELPFVLFYRIDEHAETASLVSQSGLPPGSMASPAIMDLTRTDTVWPLAQVVASGLALRIDDVRVRCGDLNCGPYPEPIISAFLLPLILPGHQRPACLLVAGVSTRLPMNDAHAAFFDHLAATVRNLIVGAVSIEEEQRNTVSFHNIIEQKRIESEFQRTNRALRTISECNQLLMRATDEQMLLEGVCRLLVEHGGYRMAWVGFTGQDEAKSVQPVAQAGFETGYLDTVHITWADTDRGRGPTGTAIRTKLPVIARNIPTDPTYTVWREAAIQRGYVSSIALPLVCQGQALGALTAYAATPDAFDAAEVALLNELADDLAYGLDVLRVRVDHQRAGRLVLEQQYLLKSLIEGTSDAVYVKDTVGRYLLANSATLRFLGKPLEAVLGHDDTDLFSPENARQIMVADRQVMASNQAQTYEDFVTLHGEPRTFLATKGPVYDAHGHVTGLFGIARDITERQRMEDALRHERDFSNAVLDALPGVFYCYDEGRKFRRWNKNFENVSGYSGEDISRMSPLDFFAGVEKELLASRIQEVFDQGFAEVEADFVAKDGTRRPYFFTGLPTMIEGRRHLVGVGIDISTRRQAEAERDRLFTLSLDMLCIAGFDGFFKQLNPAWTKTLGWSDTELRSRPWIDFVHPDDHDSTVKALAKLAQGTPLTRYENRYQCKDGSYRWISWNASPLPADHVVFAVARDTTERRQAEEERQKFFMLAESSSDFIGMCDLDMQPIYVNPAGVRMVGLPDMAAALRVKVQDYFFPEEQAFIVEKFFPRVLRDGHGDVEIRLRHFRTSEPIWVFYYLFSVRDADGKTVGWATVSRDITERKRAEEEIRQYRDHLEDLVKARTNELTEANLHLQELDRLKSLFIASMSHELRTPLNSIIGFTGIILMGMSGEISAVQRKQLGMVKKSADHLLELINDVIDVSKIETGKTELSIQAFDLCELIVEVKESFAVSASEKGLHLAWEPAELVELYSDRRRVRQLLVNLIGNAVKFTETGTVAIYLTQTATGVDIRVCDTGVGIAAEDMELLFTAFSRIHLKGRPLVEGTGLGLYLSRRIAVLLGGEITAASEPGKGSMFTLSLPWIYSKEVQ